MELADVTDSKSVGSDTVRVQVPPPAPYADMAELADALDSGSSDFTVIQVQVLLSAPYYDVTLIAVRREKSLRFLGGFSLFLHQFLFF